MKNELDKKITLTLNEALKMIISQWSIAEINKDINNLNHNGNERRWSYNTLSETKPAKITTNLVSNITNSNCELEQKTFVELLDTLNAVILELRNDLMENESIKLICTKLTDQYDRYVDLYNTVKISVKNEFEYQIKSFEDNKKKFEVQKNELIKQQFDWFNSDPVGKRTLQALSVIDETFPISKSKYDKITDTQSIRSRGLWLSAIAGMTAVGGKSKESEIVQDEFVTQK